jgi:hypothetical protein
VEVAIPQGEQEWEEVLKVEEEPSLLEAQVLVRRRLSSQVETEQEGMVVVVVEVVVSTVGVVELVKEQAVVVQARIRLW